MSSKHVHVRLQHGLGMNERGEMVEETRCRCGETWTRTYRLEADGSDE